MVEPPDEPQPVAPRQPDEREPVEPEPVLESPHPGYVNISALLRAAGLTLIALVLVFYTLCVLGLAYARFFPPPTTAVHVQRRLEAVVDREPYRKRYQWIALDRLPRHVSRSVIAAEDTRFYDHRGFDLEEIATAAAEARRGDRRRGASTITQQLVKNLFLSTHQSYVRKGVELTLTPFAEVLLPKERILELYLNVIEWGPGVYGIEAAARHHYGIPAAQLSREQAARLAAIIPAPLRRNPERMSGYAQTILGRMDALGW